MNEDLKKIKQHAYVLGGDEPETIGQQSAGIIIVCAERMAAEIERLETADVLSDEVALKNTKYIEELETDISRLKAELEKRPEIIECKNCKFKKHCNQSILRFNEKDSEDFFDKKVSFCSNGQRRESEVGK